RLRSAAGSARSRQGHYKMMSRFPCRRRGYTIIEMMVVMVVLGLLATAAMPLVELTAKRNKERELKQAIREIRHAIDAYKQASDAGRVAHAAGASGYPPSLAALTAGVPDLGPGGQMIYFLRRVPRDPFASKAIRAEASWGLRCYASTADEPKEGSDVFDVYSKSEEDTRIHADRTAGCDGADRHAAFSFGPALFRQHRKGQGNRTTAGPGHDARCDRQALRRPGRVS
ncbi:conserved hypothetical protein, partial [Ricinus communis]